MNLYSTQLSFSLVRVNGNILNWRRILTATSSMCGIVVSNWFGMESNVFHSGDFDADRNILDAPTNCHGSSFTGSRQ